MKLSRAGGLAAVALATTALQGLQSQAPAVATELIAPAPPWICRFKASAAGEWRFEILEPPADSVLDGRSILATFDTTGRTLGVVVLAEGRSSAGQRETLEVDAQFNGVRAGVRKIGVEGPKAGAGVALAETELSQVETLARWVWKHRCVPPRNLGPSGGH